jgi:hypothetical protein
MKQTKPVNTNKAKPGRKEKAYADELDLDPDVWFLEQESVLSSFQSEHEQANEHRYFN